MCSVRWDSNFILLPPVFPRPFIKETTLSSLCILVKDQLTYMHGFISRSLFCSIGLCVCLYANAIQFALLCNVFCITALYGSFVICFEIRKCDGSSFVLLAQNCLGIQSLLLFHVSFKIFFSFCKKCHWDFDRDYIKSADHLC